MILDQVPKFISPLVKEWAPHALTISFKLETDPDLLISKSLNALERYHHQIVIGNLLETRKTVVWMISAKNKMEIRLNKDASEIESQIVDELVKYHNEFIISKSSS